MAVSITWDGVYNIPGQHRHFQDQAPITVIRLFIPQIFIELWQCPSCCCHRGRPSSYKRTKSLPWRILYSRGPKWGCGGRRTHKYINKYACPVPGGEKCHEGKRKQGEESRQCSREANITSLASSKCANCSQKLPAPWSVKMLQCKALASTWVNYWYPEGLD